MAISSDALKEYKTTFSTLTESSDNTQAQNHDYCCNAVGCLSKPILRCSVCTEYYCYLHVNGHIHSMNNFEVLK